MAPYRPSDRILDAFVATAGLVCFVFCFAMH
nr:MAG TPA: hypothetical protein [Caudoviricetes sp.]